MRHKIKLIIFCMLVLNLGMGIRAAIPREETHSIRNFKAGNFSSGVCIVEGYVVKVYTCPACPQGAMCKPCMGDNIVISDNSKLIDSYSQVTDSEVIVFTDNPNVFKLGKRYKLEIRISDKKSTLEPINNLELVSYKLLE